MGILALKYVLKYIGYILYSLVFVGLATFEPLQEFYRMSYELAREITIIISGFYVYAVCISVLLTVAPKLSHNRPLLYRNHLTMASSIMVSLGLIGTFLGLVDMISGIAEALGNSEGDFGERMASLLGAISTSLGAMSFAFMTSILGVGISAYTILAGSFILSYFKEVHEKEKNSGNNDSKNDSKYGESLERLAKLEESVLSMNLTEYENQITPVALLDHLKAHNSELIDVLMKTSTEQRHQTQHHHEDMKQLMLSLSERVNAIENTQEKLVELVGVISSNQDRNEESLNTLNNISRTVEEIKVSKNDFNNKLRKIFSAE